MCGLPDGSMRKGTAQEKSRVSVTVYDENGKAMPGIPVKMYDEKDYKAFEQDNLTPPCRRNRQCAGYRPVHAARRSMVLGQSQRFLTFVVQEGGGRTTTVYGPLGKR